MLKGIVLLSAAAVAGWVLTPVVDMAIRGTIDDRTRAAIRAEARVPPAADVDVPGPRRAPDHERAVTRHGRA